MRPIDADAVFRWYVETFSEKNIGERAMKPNEIRFSMNDIRDNLDNIPTIDAVPIVRCKDCVYYVDGFPYAYCDRNAVQMIRGEDDYCSRAERRGDLDE